MPLSIIRDDITRVRCDAIVNPTNEEFIPGGGIDKRVHKVAGDDLYEMCARLGGLSVGEAKITPAYDLPCKFVIHTVGPCWEGGGFDEEKHLRSCYHQALKIAKATKCESIAFPLISSGTYGYPKDKVLAIAIEILREFLRDNDMMIYLVVFDNTSYTLSQELQESITSFIDQHYVELEQDDFEEELDNLHAIAHYRQCAKLCLGAPVDPNICVFKEKAEETEEDDLYELDAVPDFGSIGSIPRHMKGLFSEVLFDFIYRKGIDEVECYKKANVSRQTWHKIVTDRHYVPKKTTIISLAIALQLNLKETQQLLATMGYILSKSILFDIIIMYCITKKIYDVYEIDSILFKYDQKTLFSIE